MNESIEQLIKETNERIAAETKSDIANREHHGEPVQDWIVVSIAPDVEIPEICNKSYCYLPNREHNGKDYFFHADSMNGGELWDLLNFKNYVSRKHFQTVKEAVDSSRGAN